MRGWSARDQDARPVVGEVHAVEEEAMGVQHANVDALGEGVGEVVLRGHARRDDRLVSLLLAGEEVLDVDVLRLLVEDVVLNKLRYLSAGKLLLESYGHPSFQTLHYGVSFYEDHFYGVLEPFLCYSS